MKQANRTIGMSGLWVLLLLMATGVAGTGQLARPVEAPVAPDLAQSLPLIGAKQAHDLGVTGKGVKVLVIDNFRPNLDDPCNDLVHGDWVKGVLQAVAPDAEIMTFNVPLDVPGTHEQPCFAFDIDHLEDALSWALRNHRELGIKVINYSIGGGRFESLCNGFEPLAGLIRQLSQEGVLFVTAAGNNGFTNAMGFPECMPETLSVGAVYDYNSEKLEHSAVCADFPEVDKITCYSNSAFFLDVLAPGSWITVSNQLNSIGTSASAPHVAGVMAMLLQLNPDLRLSDVRDILRQTGRPVVDHRNGLTFPRVDALRAVESLIHRSNQPPVVVVSFRPLNPTIHDKVTFIAEASDPDGDVLTFTWFLDNEQQDVGGITPTWETPTVGSHRVTVRVEDGHGGVAEASIEVVVREAPSRPASVAESLDLNGDRVVGDDEILIAIHLWVTGEALAGSGLVVDDDHILNLITLWVTGDRF